MSGGGGGWCLLFVELFEAQGAAPVLFLIFFNCVDIWRLGAFGSTAHGGGCWWAVNVRAQGCNENETNRWLCEEMSDEYESIKTANLYSEAFAEDW